MPGASNFKKFQLLMWKNYVLQKRHIVQTLLEIILPLVFVAVLVFSRSLVKSTPYLQGKSFRPFSPADWNGTVIHKNLLSQLGTKPEPLKMVLYAPVNPTTDKIMANMEQIFLRFRLQYNQSSAMKEFNYTIQGYSTGEELMKGYQSIYNRVFGAVIFDENDATKYKLRLPAKHIINSDQNMYSSDRWVTSLLYPVYQFIGARDSNDNEGGKPGYYSEGFTYLQWAVDASIIRYFNESWSPSDYNIRLQRFPYPAYIDDEFLIALQGWLPFIFLLSFIYPVINTTKAIVVEKEKRLKESMKMMGLPNYLHWLAWFTKTFLLLVISAGFMTILLKTKFKGDLAIITYGSSTLLFVFLVSYLFSAVMLSFLMSSLFSKANFASTSAGILWFLTYFPYSWLQPRYDTLSQSTKMITSLLSNTGMAYGCQIISMFEGTGAGVQWRTISWGSSPQDEFSLLDCILILIFDGVIYFIAALYIEALWPGEYGVPQPWNFPFKKAFWCGVRISPDPDEVSCDSPGYHDSIEAPPINAKPGITIQSLTKSFGEKTAVKRLTLNMYENQITALLGHNGAGKTTVMSMLTGLLQPTSGTAVVNNFDIRTSINKVRDSLGFCPQHDVLFDDLTVEEHLRFFCLLKGFSQVESEINRMLHALELESKRHVQSQSLSGGMKRRLSVGIALVGGSKIVLLDEPTSGMDPGARRSTWDLLNAEKINRTIVLSTHYMEEADLLGDQIAIMAEGELQTVGSSLFLKKRYGGDYLLTMVKQPGCNPLKITEIIWKHLGTALVDQDVGAELRYSLPDMLAPLFGDMFEEIEMKRTELKIESYGLSITTMEEVFIRVGRAAVERKVQRGEMTEVPMKMLSDRKWKKLLREMEKNTGNNLLFQQLQAMIVKKLLYVSRNFGLMLVQTILPLVFLVIGLSIFDTMPRIKEDPEFPIELKQFHRTVTTVACQDMDHVCDMYGLHARQCGSRVSLASDFTKSILQSYKKDLLTTNLQYIVGMEKTANETIAFFNNQPYHGQPITLNFMSNALLKKHYNNSARLAATHFPLPFTVEDEIENVKSFWSIGFVVAFNIAFGMTFLASGFVVFLIKERESKSKHLQIVTGANFVVFWISNLIVDAVNFIIPALLLIIILTVFQAETFDDSAVLGSCFILLIFYGWAIIPIMYLFSFRYNIPSTGFTRMVMLNLTSGLAPFLATSIMQIPELNLMSTVEIFEWIFLISPNYSIGSGVTSLSANKVLGKICKVALSVNKYFCARKDNEYNLCCRKYNSVENKAYGYLDFHPAGIGRNLIFLFLVGTAGFLILLINESKLPTSLKRIRSKFNIHVTKAEIPAVIEDSDVAKEASYVRKSELKHSFLTNNLILRGLSKSYGCLKAVKNLNLSVRNTECFGLLGVNGAGKTTTFRMLTGDLTPSSGNAFIRGHNINFGAKVIRREVGYCPQFDAVIDELTGREIIQLFARLRGIKETQIDFLADELAERLLFSEHIDRRTGTYSGGNKRKLSTALACIGNPRVLLLDEPTTGMDPVARRHVWKFITQIRDAGASIVLSSHSMEECEALCNRLAIMASGEIRCLGSIQHLKSKFGDGFTIVAKMRNRGKGLYHSLQESWDGQSSFLRSIWETDFDLLKIFIEKSFPGCILKDMHPGYLHYHVKNPHLTWSELFRRMEVAKGFFNLEAYSVGQTSLEQIFLNVTKSHHHNLGRRNTDSRCTM